MAERATIFQTIQVGVETVPGTGVAASKKLAALSISPAIKVDTNKYRAMGNKFATVVVPGKEWVEASISGPLLYTDIVYPLSSLAYAAPVVQGATAAYKWTFTPALAAADTAKTFTVEQGSAERAHKFAYGLFTGLEMQFSRDGCEVSGDMIGQALTDGISMTGTPTAIGMTPVLPTTVDVKVADTQAGLTGASALTRVISASWSLRNKYGPVFPLASGSSGFAATVETEPELLVKIKMEADAAGMGLVTQMRAGSTKFVRIKGTGDLIASTYYYDIQIDTAGKVIDVSEFTDEDGLFAIEWTLQGVYDATWTKTTQVDVINTLTAL